MDISYNNVVDMDASRDNINNINNNNNNTNYNQESFTYKINYYTSRLTATHRFIEITKCCGYSEIHPILKDASLTDLYSEVRRIFQCHTKCELFIKVADPEFANMGCSCEHNFVLRRIDPVDAKNTFIQLMGAQRVQPIYSLPDPVVYRIYLDDGHRHDDHKCMFD
jgi:hypothetical protein